MRTARSSTLSARRAGTVAFAGPIAAAADAAATAAGAAATAQLASASATHVRNAHLEWSGARARAAPRSVRVELRRNAPG